MSLYTDMLAAGVPIDNHYSDLYVKDCPEAREVLKRHKCRSSVFRNNLDGELWIDVPFAFEPYWEGRGMSLHIEGRRWFQKSYGNTYHSVRIYQDGELVHSSGQRYGYGDQYLQTALEALKTLGLAPKDAEYGTLYLREKLGASYSVADVGRERDL